MHLKTSNGAVPSITSATGVSMTACGEKPGRWGCFVPPWTASRPISSMRVSSTASDLLARIAQTLDSRGIPYMVIGGQAVLVYGEPRLTKDIDITLGLGPDRLGDLLAVVSTLGLRPLVDPQTFTRETLVLPCEEDDTGHRVDFILSFSEYERDALQRTRATMIEDVRVRFASPEDVIIHKMVAGRPRDLEDVASIVAKVPALDEDYLFRWLRAFEGDVARPLEEPLRQLLRDRRTTR